MTSTTIKKPVLENPVPKVAPRPPSSGMGLDSLGDLSSLLNAPAPGAGPMDLPIDLIDEDPGQPRSTFDEVTLAELADSIRLRGVKTPISVRPNPDVPGRYIINHGARRYRGSRLAGKTTVPGFVDSDYTEADQVIENLQRDGLTAREIANFIGRELSRGKKKKEIAQSIAKSAAYVSQHVTLLDLPDPIAQAFNEDRCRDVTVINELVTAYKQDATEVESWLENTSQEITRGSVRLLREFLDAKTDVGREKEEEDEAIGVESHEEREAPSTKPDSTTRPDRDRLKKAIVLVRHDKRPARLVLTRRPSADGLGWLRYEDDGTEVEAELARITLDRLVEG